jgi:aryl-alcohol dehydrogenase-like predicted oxidoreductase
MEFRHLGRSGLIVSAISYGNWLTHGGQIEQDQASACVRAALDSGITTFDTADVYAGGRAEEVLGEALKGERREGLEVFTKVYWPMGEGRNDRGLSRKHLMEGIDASLRRLQMDYVDLYQAHRYDTETPLEETMQAFADIVRAGKAHYIGVSEWTADQIRDAKAMADGLGVSLVSNQPQYSALWRVIEGEVVPTCEALGVGQVVWSPIAGGVLTGKYRPGSPAPEGSRGSGDDSGSMRFLRDAVREDVLGAVAKLEPIAAEHDLSMAALAVAWVLHNDNVSSAIVGATRPEQVQDNVRAAGVRLDDEVKATIDEILAPVAVTDTGETARNAPKERP